MCPRPLDDGGALRLLVFRTFITLTNLSESVNYFAKVFFLVVRQLVAIGFEDGGAVADRPEMSNLEPVGVLRGESQTSGAGDVAELHGDRSIAPKTANYRQLHLYIGGCGCCAQLSVQSFIIDSVAVLNQQNRVFAVKNGVLGRQACKFPKQAARPTAGAA